MQPSRIPGLPGTTRNYTHDLPPPPSPAAKPNAEKRRARKQKAKSLKRWRQHLENEKYYISQWDRLVKKEGFERAWEWGADWMACIAEYMVETKMGWSERCEMETRKEEEKEGEGGESLGK